MSPAAKPAKTAKRSKAPARAAAPAARPPTSWAPASAPAAAPRATASGSAPRRQVNYAGDFGLGVYEVARKEVLQHIRTKRLLIIAIAMAILLFAVTLVFGPRIANNFDADGPNSHENIVLAFYFGFGLIGGLIFTQLLSIVLTSDAVCSEWNNRTIFLLLSKPVSRTAFVVGKFLGNVVVLAGTIALLFTVDYILMQPFYDGSPSGAEVGGFFKTLLVVILGCTAYASMALFFSTLTRSTIQSTLLTLAMWIIILPLVGALGLFSSIGDDNAGSEEFFDSKKVQTTLYFNPASCMQATVQLLLPHDNGEFTETLRFLNFFNPAPNNLGLAATSLAIYAAVFFAASILVVQRRNFE